MDENKLYAVWAIVIGLIGLSLVGVAFRSCDNTARVQIECVKSGRDPLACKAMTNQ